MKKLFLALISIFIFAVYGYAQVALYNTWTVQDSVHIFGQTVSQFDHIFDQQTLNEWEILYYNAGANSSLSSITNKVRVMSSATRTHTLTSFSVMIGTGGLQVKKGTSTLGGGLTTHQVTVDTLGNAIVNGNITVKGKLIKYEILQPFTLDSSQIKLPKKWLIGYTPNGITIDTIYYQDMKIVGSPSVTPKPAFGTNISATGTYIISSPSAVTSISTITKVSSFNNATIPANSSIWLSFSALGTLPTTFSIVIKYH